MTRKVKIYADGADIDKMKRIYQEGVVKGFTTNPSLMKKAGVTDYNAFAKAVVKAIPDLSISFEVFADDFATMEKEAEKIAAFGSNVFVKIPITNTKGESSVPLIEKLAAQKVKVNVTALFTVEQVQAAVAVLKAGVPAIVSVFAGRVADTGVDPMPLMKESARLCHQKEGVELLWASSRELFNIMQAELAGADIITCTPEIIAKIPMIGMDLNQLSLETVQTFNKDIKALGFAIL